MNKISIIIPCYNVEQYIDRCFDSIKNQTYGIDNLEIILVEDGSTDNTYQKLLDIEDAHTDNVIIIRNDTNTKPGTARNTGLAYATGDYVMFIDSDDWVDTQLCEKLMKVSLDEDCDMVMCNSVRDFGDGRVIKLKDRTYGEKLLVIDSPHKRRALIAEDRLGNYCYAKLMKKDVLLGNNIFFPEGIVFEDITWGALCYGYFSRIGLVNDYLYHYFVNENSVVLKKGQDYYQDMLTANELKWEQCLARGLHDMCPLETEFDFLVSYYIGSLTMFAKHYDSIPIKVYEHIRDYIRANIPDYARNPYIGSHLSSLHQNLFFFLDKPMDESALSQLHAIIRG